MKTRRNAFIVPFAVLICVAVVSAGPPEPHLSRAEVMRIADSKAQRVLHRDPHSYSYFSLYYDPKGGAWWVNYRPKGGQFTEFSVQVYDKTRKAFVWLQ